MYEARRNKEKKDNRALSSRLSKEKETKKKIHS
jgi:hypothetical protein